MTTEKEDDVGEFIGTTSINENRMSFVLLFFSIAFRTEIEWFLGIVHVEYTNSELSIAYMYVHRYRHIIT